MGVIRNTNFAKDGTINDSDLAWLDVEAQKFEKRKLRFGDIILEKSGGGPKQPVGRVAIFEKKEGNYSFSNFTSAIRVNDASELDFRFLHKFLFWKHMSGTTEAMQSHSTGIRNLNADEYKEIAVPLPPIHEQHRILAVLDAALPGLATATAYAKNNLENARELFESCLNSSFESNSENWQTTSLQALCEKDRIITYGVIKLGTETTNGVPCLRTSNVRRLQIDTDGVKKISPALSNEFRRTILRSGEVLVNVRGTLGGVAMTTPDMKGWNVSREVAVVPVDANRIDPAYLAYFIASRKSQVWLTNMQKGLAYVGINIADLRALPVSFPDPQTQARMIQQFGELSAECRRLEAIYGEKLTQIDELKRAVLKAAFSGELSSVPPQAIDEAAE